MSFRSGDLKRDNRPQLTLSDLSKGQKVEGRVKKAEDYGLFIEIEGSKLSGLCHKSEVLAYLHSLCALTHGLLAFRQQGCGRYASSSQLPRRRQGQGDHPFY